MRGGQLSVECPLPEESRLQLRDAAVYTAHLLLARAQSGALRGETPVLLLVQFVTILK